MIKGETYHFKMNIKKVNNYFILQFFLNIHDFICKNPINLEKLAQLMLLNAVLISFLYLRLKNNA